MDSILKQFWTPNFWEATPIRLHYSETFWCKEKNGITAPFLIIINNVWILTFDRRED